MADTAPAVMDIRRWDLEEEKQSKSTEMNIKDRNKNLDFYQVKPASAKTRIAQERQPKK